MTNEQKTDETLDRTPRALTRARERAREIGVALELTKRGALDLKRDTAQHRRFAWLYDDLLS